jgi:hypothetical protein
VAPLIEYGAPYQTVCNYFVLTFTNFGEFGSEPAGDGTMGRSLLKLGNMTQDDRLSDSNADRPADVPAGLDPQEAQAEDLEDFQRLEDRTERLLDRAEEELDRVEGLAPGAAIPAGLDLPGGLEDLLGPTLDELELRALTDALERLVDRLAEQLESLEDAGELDLTSYHLQPYQPAIDGQGNADCQAGQNGFPDRLVTTGRYPPSSDPDESGGSHVVFDPNTPGLAGPTYTGIARLQDVDDEQRPRHPQGEVP